MKEKPNNREPILPNIELTHDYVKSLDDVELRRLKDHYRKLNAKLVATFGGVRYGILFMDKWPEQFRRQYEDNEGKYILLNDEDGRREFIL